MTFPDVETTAQSPVNLTRQKRQLADQAIAQASAAAVGRGRRDEPQAARARARRRGREPPGQGALGAGRARRRPRALPDRAGARPDQPDRRAEHRPAQDAAGRRRREDRPGPGGQQGARSASSSRRPARPGFAFLTDLADPRQLAQVNPGDAVELTPEGNRLIAHSNGVRIGVVEPRVAARLLKLIADGNKYAAGVTSLGDKDVRIIIREIFQDPRQLRQGQLPDRRQVDRPAPVHEGHPRPRGDGPRGGPRGRRGGRGDRGPRSRPAARVDDRRGLRGRARRARRAVGIAPRARPPRSGPGRSRPATASRR